MSAHIPEPLDEKNPDAFMATNTCSIVFDPWYCTNIHDELSQSITLSIVPAFEDFPGVIHNPEFGGVVFQQLGVPRYALVFPAFARLV